MKKLTDEQLSRVLSQQAIGKLRHDTFGVLDSGSRWHLPPMFGCGCVAGAALALGNGLIETTDDEERMAAAISNAVAPQAGVHYPSTPESLLAYLAKRGLA